MGERNLTKAQREMLFVLQNGPRIDITDQSVVGPLVARGLAFKFFESDGGDLRPVWAITDKGRSALEASK